jgi:hypothetical protein
MAGIFDSLAEFFEGLFTSDPAALRAKRQLREQMDVLHEVKPPVYSARADQVLPGFAQGWAQAHALLQPLRDLFDKTLSHPDPKTADLSLTYLVESVLSGEVTDRRLAFSFDALKDRFGRSSDAAKEATVVTSEFNNLLMDLRRQDSEKVQKDFEALYRLRALAGHSLVPLLHRFGYDASAQAQHFHAVDAGSVVTELLDLYFVAEGLDLGPGVEALLGLLLEKVGPSKAAENRRKTAQLLDRLRDLSRGTCSPYLLLQLIRVAQRNPEAQPEVQRFSERYVQVYAGTLTERFARDRERALRERSESTLEADIASLFPGTPLLPLKYYNTETSDTLVNAGLPSLTVVKPLQLLKSFGFAVLKTGYLDAVKRVVLDGFFLEKDWGQRFSDALYAAEEVLDRLDAFDHGLETDGKAGLAALEKYLGGKAPISSVPKALVDKMNRNAQAVLEGEAQVLSLLAQRVQEVLGDYKSPQPQYVGNIKGIGGKDQRALVEALINGYNKTAQLLRILKHFVVVK